MPGSSGAIRAGKAYVELGTDNNALSRGLNAAQAKLRTFGASIRGFGSKLMGVGMLIAAPLEAAALGFAAQGAALSRLSERTGMSVEALSELAVASKQVGVSSEGFESGVRKMQKFVVAAAKGGAEAQQTLGRLGISVEQLGRMTPDAQLDLFADKIASIHDPAVKAATAMEIFGKGGTEMIPLLDQGAAGIEALRKKARDLGLSISTKDAKAAEVFSQALSTLWDGLQKLSFAIGEAVGESLTSFVQHAAEAVGKVIAWAKENKGLIQHIFAVAVAVVAAGAAIYALGMVISGVAAVFGVIAGAISAVVTVFSILLSVIGFLFSPLGLVVAIAVGLGVAFVRSSGIIGKAIGHISAAFSGMKEDVATAFGAIGDALSKGDFASAASILWATIKVVWQRGSNALVQIWEDLKDSVYNVVVGMGTSLASAGAAIVYVLRTAWLGLTTAISKAWSWMMMGMQRGWNAFSGYFRKKWIDLKSLVDPSIHFEAEKAKIDGEGLAEANAIQAEYEKKINDLNSGKEKTAKEIEADNAAAFGAIDQGGADRKAQRLKDRDANLAGAQAALEAAKRERDKAIADAKAKGDQIAPAKVEEKKKNADNGLEGLQRKFAVEGTFNAAAVRGFSAGNDPALRAAKAAEAANAFLKSIDANTRGLNAAKFIA